MMQGLDKAARAAVFRARLESAMARAGRSRSALARDLGVDRTTVGQMLSPGATRMPNAHVAAEAARVLGVSADWLLGLADRPERVGDVVAAAVTVTEAARSPDDAEILGWYREAAGYKLRHVPATLPDMLKTEAVLRWEYAAHLGKTPDQAVQTMRDRVAWLSAGDQDVEIAMPAQELAAFAAGVGYWAGLDARTRRDQLGVLAAFHDAHYPALRLFLFDARRVFSAPVTVFGPLLAVIYVGRVHLCFRDRDRVRVLSDHFDWLVREATVDAREAGACCRALAEDV